MAEHIIARLQKQHDDTLQWMSIENSDAGELQQGSLQDLARAAENMSVSLLLPASEVLLIGLELPVKTNSQIKKALPFALEDLLADEVDTYHNVWQKQPDGKIYVALTNIEKFKACLASFEQAGINLVSVYPESLCLPYEEQSCSLVLEGEHAILRQDKYLGAGVDRDMLPIILDKVLVENPELKAIECWSVDELNLHIPEHSIDINYHKVDSILALLATGVATLGSPFNLVSGDFKKKQGAKWQGKKYLPPLALFVITGLLQTGFLINSYSQQKSELAALEAQTQALFKETFPEISRVVNIKAQAEQALIELNKKTTSKGGAFMSLLYQTGEVLNANEGYKVQQLDFINDLLQVQLTMPDIAQVEQIKQQLQDSPGLTLKIQSEVANNDGVEVHFEIRPK